MPRRKQFSKVNRPTKAQQNSFFDLPAEIRNLIYEFTFDVEVEIPRRSKYSGNGRSTPSGLLMTCKQAYDESIQLYYLNTPFYFRYEAMYRLQEWLNKIGRARAALIRHIHIQAANPRYRSSAYPSSDYCIQDCARQGQDQLDRFREKLTTEKFGLAAGALKAELRVDFRSTWTTSPMYLADRFMDGTTWDGECCRRIWKEESTEDLKALFPFILTR